VAPQEQPDSNSKEPKRVSSEKRFYFAVSVVGDPLRPIIKGITDMPDGTMLFVNVRKPWLPDGQQRVARGVPACGEDCFPATTGATYLTGANVVVKRGNFAAGPFSFRGEPFPPGTYPLDISLMANLKTATVEQIRATGTILYTTTIDVGAKEKERQPAASDVSPKLPSYPEVSKPNYSEKIEADNGAVYMIDLHTARHFAAGVEAGVYDQGRGGVIPMYFDCAGHMGELGGPMSYVPPRSVGARLAAIACAEAARHPER
jgi:hypothetical protein